MKARAAFALGSRRAGVGAMKARAGFTLVEALLALVLFGVVLLPLTGVTLAAAARQRAASGTAALSAALLGEAGRYEVVPFDSLPGLVGCDTVLAQPLPYARCVSMPATGSVRRVTVVLRPLAAGVRTDSVVLERAAPPANPLDVP